MVMFTYLISTVSCANDLMFVVVSTLIMDTVLSLFIGLFLLTVLFGLFQGLVLFINITFFTVIFKDVILFIRKNKLTKSTY